MPLEKGRRYYKEVISLLGPLEFNKVCYMLGKSYLALREKEKAIDTFEKCDDARAKADLAVLYFELGQKDQSERILSTLQDKRLLSDALFRMGRQCLTREDYRCAIDYLSRMEPSYKREFNLGLSYYALGDYSKALDSFLRSLEYTKDKEEALCHIIKAQRYKKENFLGKPSSLDREIFKIIEEGQCSTFEG